MVAYGLRSVELECSFYFPNLIAFELLSFVLLTYKHVVHVLRSIIVIVLTRKFYVLARTK